MTARIRLILQRPDGHNSTAEVDGGKVTTPMFAAAEDLLETLTTGERPPSEGLYDLCAQAFGTTREDAKKRLVAAMYGKRGKAIT